MAWKEDMYEALAGYLREPFGIDAVTVVDFDDRTEYGGYCSTCAHEETVCDIKYLDSNGKVQTYTYYGTFTELIGSIS